MIETCDFELYVYETGEFIRMATPSELMLSVDAAVKDKGQGIILVDGVECYVIINKKVKKMKITCSYSLKHNQALNEWILEIQFNSYSPMVIYRKNRKPKEAEVKDLLLACAQAIKLTSEIYENSMPDIEFNF